MSTDIHHIVASYDISDPKRLNRVAKAMEDYGTRVLYSVFECNIDGPRFMEMKNTIEQIIDPMEDSVRYYFLCHKCITQVEYSGRGDLFVEDEEYTIV